MRIKHLKFLLLLAALLAALLASACGSAAPQVETPLPGTDAPTVDLDLLRTEVAATVLAQCAGICALTPSATLPPTATVAPSATPTPEQTATTDATLNATETTGTAEATTGDLAKWISQSVPDGTRFAPGESFTMVWRLQNTGETTWTSGYRLRHFTGERFGAPAEIELDRDVLPEETIDISVPMRAPNTAGRYRSDWVMSNETRYNFKEPVFLEIVVGNPPTATPTSVTPTPTITMQMPTATP